MTSATAEAEGRVWQASKTTPGGNRLGDSVVIALVATGVGLAVIVGREGTLAWQLLRVAAVAALTAVVFRQLRRGGVLADLVVFLLGSLAMPVGLGYGIQHVDKTGLSLSSAAGVLTFVGGSALLAVGVRYFLRRVARWTRFPLALALLTVIATGAWVLAQAVALTNVPPTHLDAATPADHGVAYEDVTFPTRDGITMSGWYISSDNGAAVALLHGSGSTRSAILDHAVMLAENGYGVLLFDARGHGRSGGNAMDAGWYGDEDVSGAVSYLTGRPDVDPTRIAAVGLSMGGEEAIGAAASDERLNAVVAEGATGRVTGDREWLVTRYGWRGALTQRIDWLTYGITDLLTAADPPITLRQAATASPSPMLLIAAGSVPTEQHAAAYIQAGSPATVDVWVVAGSGHTGGLRTQPAEWESRVVGFLDATLLQER